MVARRLRILGTAIQKRREALQKLRWPGRSLIAFAAGRGSPKMKALTFSIVCFALVVVFAKGDLRAAPTAGRAGLMLSAGAAASLAVVGFLLVLPLCAARAALRLAIHVCAVVGVTLIVAVAGASFDFPGPWLMGSWFATLAAVYVGHAFAMRNWGSPISRTVLLFGLARLHLFARMNPMLTMAAVPGVAAAFVLGWAVARWNVHASAVSLLLGVGAASALLAAADAIGRAAQLPARGDLLVGIILGGHGPQTGPPPDDPSLGHRWPVRYAGPPPRRRTVIIFVVDSLRARSTSAYGYERPTTPFLRALVEQRGAARVPLAVSNSADSALALWSILSSRRARHLAVNAPCLHDVLRAAGFGVRFFLSGAHRHWIGLEHLYGNDVDAFEDCLVDDDLVTYARALPIKAVSRGDFLFFHLMSAHVVPGRDAPLVWTPARHRYAFDESDALDTFSRKAMCNHYDNGVSQADACLASIVEALSAKGLLDDALVVVTSDHGEALADRTPVAIGHGRSLYQESIHVPLVVWDTTQSLTLSTHLADHTDIAPTIADALGVRAPSAWQGSSVLAGPARRTAHVEHILHCTGALPTYMEAVLADLPSGMFKTMRSRQAGREVMRQSFCLSRDPDEQEDVTPQLADDVQAAIDLAAAEYRNMAPKTSWRYLYDPA